MNEPMLFYRMAPGMMTVKDNPNVSRWSFDFGYKDRKDDEYPMRTTNKILFNPVLTFQRHIENIEYHCKATVQGIKLILSMPGDSLKISHNNYRLPLSKYNLIKFNVKLTTTSEGLRRYPPNKRQCFYDSERRLRFFRNYTQNNCETECLANFTKVECGCVKFSMPSKCCVSIHSTSNK